VLNLLYYFVLTEKNWNITLPGFGGDEIKGYRKPVSID
jgi:transcription initiation factor TFIID subunit 12